MKYKCFRLKLTFHISLLLQLLVQKSLEEDSINGIGCGVFKVLNFLNFILINK